MSFYIEKEEIDEVLRSCMDLEDSVSDASANVIECVEALNGLSSFDGSAAQSIKEYFVTTHKFLMDQAKFMMTQLSSDYTKHAQQYDEEPIAENRDAKLSEDEMQDKSIWVGHALPAKCLMVEMSLNQAKSALPHNANVWLPNTSALSSSLVKQKRNIDEFKDQVAQAETTGKSLFANNAGSFQRLYSSLMTILASIKEGDYDITVFDSSAFYSMVEESGFPEAYEAALADQRANYESMIKTKENAAQRINERLEEEKSKSVAGKSFWALVGMGCEVATMVVGIAAFAGAAAASGPVLLVAGGLLAAGTIASMGEISARADQMIEMMKGDVGADKEKVDRKEYKNFKRVSKVSKEGMNFAYKQDAKSFAGGIGKVGSVLIDAGGSYLKGQIDSKEGKLVVGVSAKLASEGWERYASKALTGACGAIKSTNVVSLTASIVQMGADYGVDKADENIEKVLDQQDKLNKSLENSKSRNPFERSSSWSAAMT